MDRTVVGRDMSSCKIVITVTTGKWIGSSKRRTEVKMIDSSTSWYRENFVSERICKKGRLNKHDDQHNMA